MKKNIWKLLGVIALVAVIGLGLAGCPTDGGDGGGGNGGGDPVKAATPTADPACVTANAPVEVASGTGIALSTTTTGADIYYTTDGTTPGTGSPMYSSSAKPAVTAATIIKAIAVKDGMTGSDVLTAVYTVSDALTWTEVTVSQSGFINGTTRYAIRRIAWGGGKFVAGSGGTRMAYSADGETWTVVSDSTFGASGAINDIAWGGDKFVAVGKYGSGYGIGSTSSPRIAYSSDGETWTAASISSIFGTSSESYVYRIAWGGGKFVAGGYGKTAYSSDGVTWTAGDDSEGFSCIAWGGDKFVAEGSSGNMAYSSDGVTWTAVTDSTFVALDNIYDIAWGGGKFVAVGG
jgi:hypothetical protein